ncbi:hypothetical protein CEXT_158811 [Caerostris extrusa]|uniref:Uncharacterized protein n=1 Tax=Caerostris extrusa TaxID=172846 RepID=A0AAV4ULE0_CAEEX|nr:hypothetical protein CEXT_158811 [Caerostris extrusa]
MEKKYRTITAISVMQRKENRNRKQRAYLQIGQQQRQCAVRRERTDGRYGRPALPVSAARLANFFISVTFHGRDTRLVWHS